MKRKLALLLVLFAVLLAAGCAPPQVAPSAPAPSPVAETKAVPVPAAPAGLSEWERLVEAAKREGKVVVYMTAGGDVRPAMVQGFKKSYGLAVETISGKGAEVAEKLMSERRAGLHLADVFVGGTTTQITQLKPAGVLEPLEPLLLLPEVVDSKVWWGGGLLWVDKGHYTLAFNIYPNPMVAINTNLVKPDEVKSYKDLLNPRWKGKIVINDPTVAGIGARAFTIGADIMGMDFWRELAKQEPVILRDQRLQVEWLAHGRHSILIAPASDAIASFLKAGASVKVLNPAEGVGLTCGYGAVSLINRAAHPNATKVFVNWLLSREGQEVWSKAMLVPSAWEDVSVEHVDVAKLREPGVKYVNTENEEFLFKQPENMKLAKEIFASLMK